MVLWFVVFKKANHIFFYFIPVIIIFGFGVIVATILILLPQIGVNTRGYKQVLGDKTYRQATGIK